MRRKRNKKNSKLQQSSSKQPTQTSELERLKPLLEARSSAKRVEITVLIQEQLVLSHSREPENSGIFTGDSSPKLHSGASLIPIPELDSITSSSISSCLSQLRSAIHSNKDKPHFTLLHTIRAVYESLAQEFRELSTVLQCSFKSYTSVVSTAQVMFESLFQAVIVNDPFVSGLLERTALIRALPVAKECAVPRSESPPAPKPQKKEPRRLRHSVSREQTEDEEMTQFQQSIEAPVCSQEKLKPLLSEQWVQRVKKQLGEHFPSAN